MIRWHLSLLSPPSTTPPGWILYGQEIHIGGDPDCSLTLPLPPRTLHCYLMGETLWGVRLTQELPVAVNGTPIALRERLVLPHSFTFAAGEQLFSVTASLCELTEEEQTALRALHGQRPHLTWADTDGVRFDLHHWGDLIIGRGATAHIRFADPTVSRTHFSLTASGARWQLTPAAPVSLAGRPVKHTVTLPQNERISFGDREISLLTPTGGG